MTQRRAARSPPLDGKAGLRREGLLLGRTRPESVGSSQGEGERYSKREAPAGERKAGFRKQR